MPPDVYLLFFIVDSFALYACLDSFRRGWYDLAIPLGIAAIALFVFMVTA